MAVSRAELLARVPVAPGQTPVAEVFRILDELVHQFTQHFTHESQGNLKILFNNIGIHMAMWEKKDPALTRFRFDILRAVLAQANIWHGVSHAEHILDHWTRFVDRLCDEHNSLYALSLQQTDNNEELNQLKGLVEKQQEKIERLNRVEAKQSKTVDQMEARFAFVAFQEWKENLRPPSYRPQKISPPRRSRSRSRSPHKAASRRRSRSRSPPPAYGARARHRSRRRTSSHRRRRASKRHK